MATKKEKTKKPKKEKTKKPKKEKTIFEKAMTMLVKTVGTGAATKEAGQNIRKGVSRTEDALKKASGSKKPKLKKKKRFK